MVFEPTQSNDIRLLTLPQLAPAGPWQVELAHDRPQSLLIWLTRGQGVALLDGERRGFGSHNAIFVPSRHLISLEIGRQAFGQVLVLPDGIEMTLPQEIQHLRVRDSASHSELTALFEAMGREQNAQRPLCQSAVFAYADLMMIWVRRHISEAEVVPRREKAAQTLVRKFCARVVSEFASGDSMADYASHLGVTPTHLTRVCRSETGKTAATLLTERLVHAARSLLISTDVPVQDIACHLGFGSPAYFTRFVQQHTGHAPTSLRRAARTKQ